MIYLAICFIILSGYTTALASAAHGGNYASKVYVVLMHTFLFPTVAPLFWLFCRRHKQADAELKYLEGKATFEDVREAYPLGMGYFVAPVIEWCLYNPWPHLGPVPTRIQQELCGGFVCGALLAIPTLFLGSFYG